MSKNTKNTKKVIIPLSPIDILGPVGYYSKNPQYKRRAALRIALKKYAYKDIISRLNATAIRFKNTHPDITTNIRNDMIYLKSYREKTYKK